MTMTLIADAPVDVDAEGFLTDPEQWNERIAQAIAVENGIPELTDDTGWLSASCATATSQTISTEPEAIEKVAIVISKGSLEGIYPGLIMANGARMEGTEADLFFTFFCLDAIRKDRYEKIKVATVGNPGMHMMTAWASFYETAAGGQVIFT
jgi:DsrE/DsrF/DrsH-like family